MHIPVIAPTVLRIVPLATTTGDSCCFVELSAFLVSGSNLETVFDLFIKKTAEVVTNDIARAKDSGLLMALVSTSDGTNPMTGRPWHTGQIGCANEITPPLPYGLLPAPENGETCVFAPTIDGISPAKEASRYFDEYPDTTCLTLLAGDDGDVLHVVVPMKADHVGSFVQNAKTVRNQILVWYGPRLPEPHTTTGRPVHIGTLGKVGDRADA